MITVTLPYPPRSLHPNGRAHWAEKAKDTKRARTDAWGLTLSAIGGQRPSWEAVTIQWAFHPKTANRPDDDGLVAMCKAYRDGIADALKIDDKNFTMLPVQILEPIKGGKVVVTLTPHYAI